MPSDALWSAYASTILLIGRSPRIKVDLREPLSDEQRELLTNLGLGKSFAIVTPYDPRGERSPTWKNLVRYFAMRVWLTAHNLKSQPADGQSPDASHRERGFAIAMGRREAADLARSLEQLALYWFDCESFWIDGALAPRAPERLAAVRGTQDLTLLDQDLTLLDTDCTD
jgi:hypothetical protein